MAAITILTLAQVFWRYILELPLQWSEEIARYCFVWVTFLGAATLMRLQDGHPAIDALYVRVSSKAQQVMDVVSKLMVVVGSLAIAVGGLRLVLLQWNQLSPSVEIPMAISMAGHFRPAHWSILGYLVPGTVAWKTHHDFCGLSGGVCRPGVRSSSNIHCLLGWRDLAMAAAIPGLSIMTAVTLVAQRMFVGIDVFPPTGDPVVHSRRSDLRSRRYGAMTG